MLIDDYVVSCKTKDYKITSSVLKEIHYHLENKSPVVVFPNKENGLSSEYVVAVKSDPAFWLGCFDTIDEAVEMAKTFDLPYFLP